MMVMLVNNVNDDDNDHKHTVKMGTAALMIDGQNESKWLFLKEKVLEIDKIQSIAVKQIYSLILLTALHDHCQ